MGVETLLRAARTRSVRVCAAVLCWLCLSAGSLPAQTAGVDLGAADVETGLSNTRRAAGTDGENDPLICGPAADQRGARQPKGLSTGPPTGTDLPDHFLYFTVANLTVASAAVVTVRVMLFDDAAAAGQSVALEYTTGRAASAAQLREVFFLHPYEHLLAGSGAWVTLSWVLRDAGFGALQHSTADFRVSSRAASGSFTRLCYDRAEASVGAPAPVPCPTLISASVDEDDGRVRVSWTNGTVYERFLVLRNGIRIAILPGDASSLEDLPPPGRYRYHVVALKAGEGCLSPRLAREVRVFPDVSRCGCPNPDCNLDGTVDLQDVAIVASNLGLAPADPRFGIEGDANRDGLVDMDDVFLVLLYLRGPPTFPTLERRLEPLAAVGTVADPGPMVRIESPYALGSRRLEEIRDSLLHHGRLLVVSGSGAAEKLIELDPASGIQTIFSEALRADAAGDPALAGVAALSFEGPAVAVANQGAPDASALELVGSMARLDPRSGNPLEGPAVGGGPATGVFVGDQDAIDGRIGPETGFRPAGGYLSETGGTAEGGAGLDGPEPAPQNRTFFQGNWESDTRRRRASVTGVDLDTGLYEVAAVDDPAQGILGPLAFVVDAVPPGELPAPLPLPVAIHRDADEGVIENSGSPDENSGIALAGMALITADAGPEDRVNFTIGALELPASGDYVVRVAARLPPGVLFSTLRVEAAVAGTALERRVRRGLLPGKLGSVVSVLPLGRIELRAGVAETLRLSAAEPGAAIESIELEGPVGSRLYAFARDPGSIRVYGLARGTAPTGPTGAAVYRGVLERIAGVCEIEAARDAETIIDPIAVELTTSGGETKLLLLDGLRRTVNYFSLEGDLERCVHVPLAASYLTGMASGPGGAEGLPTLYLSARATPGGGGGGQDESGEKAAAAAAAGGVAPGGGEHLPAPGASGVLSVLDIDEIFFDREASGIVEPLAIQATRDLVLKAKFFDGTIGVVTPLAHFANLHPLVVELTPTAHIRARRAAGFADIQAELQGLVTETRVLVSARTKPFRRDRAVPFNAAPPLGEILRIYPNPEAMTEAFGTMFSLLRFPVGYRQWFTAVEFDSLGRAGAAPGTLWTSTSAAGNSISSEGILAANASENPSEVGVDGGGSGLSILAATEGPRGSLESAPRPVAVYDPVEIPDAPLAAIRIFPRSLQVLPGSTLRFVAVLVDEDGLLRNIEPPEGEPDPTLPGARWSSDGLPIDERTGLFRALYAGETVDETCTITVHDPTTGLSDAVSVTVLYSQTNGLGVYADAQLERLGEAALTLELKELMVTAHEKQLHEIKVDRENSNLAALTLKGDFEGLVESLDSVFFGFDSSFELDYLGEMLFLLEGEPEFSIVERTPGEGKRYLEVRIRLRLADLLEAQMGDYELEVSFNTLPSYLLDLCDVVPQKICDVKICEKIQKLRKKAGEKPLLKDQVKNDFGEILNSRIEIVTHLDLTSGDFGTDFTSASWRTLGLENVSDYLSRLFVEATNIKPQLTLLKEALLRTLFGKDETNCELNLSKYLFKPVAEAICGGIEAVFAAIGVNLAGIHDICVDSLTKLMEEGVKYAINKVIDKQIENLDEFLSKVIEEQIVVPIEKFVYREIKRTGIIREVELGFAALASIGDQGRIGSLRLGGAPVSDPAVSLSNAPLGEFAGTSLYFDQDLVAYRHALSFLFGLFPTHAALWAAPRIDASVTSGNPLEPENGPGRGNVGVAAQADDVASNLARYAGSTAYRTGATLRGAVPLGVQAVSALGESVTLSAASTAAPRFVFIDGAPGGLQGRVEQLALTKVTGTIEYTVSSVATAPLSIVRSGRRVTVDIPAGAPAIVSPLSGEVPFATEIRSLVAASIPDLRVFLLGTLGLKLPITIEYPTKVGERPGLGHIQVDLLGADTDDALEDDIVLATFIPAPAGGGDGGANEPGANEPGAGGLRFRRGDCNEDTQIDVSDAVSLVLSLRGEAALRCRDGCDMDGNGSLDWTDPVYFLTYLTGGGRPPPEPFAECGGSAREVTCAGGSHACR